MSIHDLANQDTPGSVSIPNTWPGIAAWFFIRFGGLGIATLFLYHAWDGTNKENIRRTDAVLEIMERRAVIDSEMVKTLEQLKAAVEEVSNEAKRAHNQFHLNNNNK